MVANCDQKNNQIETRGGKYKNPRVFTEQGVAMLATILKSNVAVQVSIAIMDAFVIMRKYISNDLIKQKYINNLVIKHDEDIKLLQESFNQFEEKKKVDVTIICKNNGLLKQIDINKYQQQYNNLKIVYNNDFHDRYIIIDQKEIYHCAASLNHVGSKTFQLIN